MDWVSLTAALAFATFLFSVAFAFYSKRKVDARREDNDVPKSTLAKDKDSHGKPSDL